MIPAHGAQLTVSTSGIRIAHSALRAALTGEDEVEVALEQVTGVSSTPPSLIDVGHVTLAGPGTVITFAPGQAAEAKEFVAAVEAALRGEAPATSGVPGLDAVVLDGLHAVRLHNGEAVEERELQLGEVASFVGDLPVLAHDAQMVMIALRHAFLAAGEEVPEFEFGCTLSLERATGSAQVTGPVEETFRAAGLSLGILNAQRVWPVLRTALAPAPAPAPEEKKPTRRAPWQSVATPDVIPQANPDADPTNPLFGHHVTLTGDFEPFDKGRLWSAIADLGADIGKNVTKKTTILVAGTWATKTSKEKRAEELIDQGQALQIWTGEQLIAVLGLTAEDEEQPPF
ncbi:MAG: hypothetical protein Q4G50_02560 [Corynebacterium sp.]|uniref:hypothetical protein n=1 Tax=Corynebacterium sp. TaxID=1720 RepID=UPI0026DF3220|nr:hypothetical protein [Corynebacterium sp.]MDO5668866.1 hypothetical protein [Corynebacterium sp.]